nr:type VII secretion system-associated protein [Actinocatenispora thailandica]
MPVDLVAAATPDKPLRLVDPYWDGSGPVPEWAVVGQWPCATAGRPGAFEANPGHRPSPWSLGWPEPTDPVDAAAYRLATEYGDLDALLGALAAAQVAVLVDAWGEPVRAIDPEGGPVVPVFTAEDQAAAVSGLGTVVCAVRELVPRLPDGHDLLLNPAGAATTRVPADALVGVLGR